MLRPLLLFSKLVVVVVVVDDVDGDVEDDD
jgi:hypothetical protein